MVESSSTINQGESDNIEYDLLIIGGGVVGCAVLRAATLEGWKCALVEAEPHLLYHASGSNSGIACTGVDASPGTLERALIRDSNSMFRMYCKTHNIPTRPCGSLVCAWPWDITITNEEEAGHGLANIENKKEVEEEEFHKNNLRKVYHESYDANDTHVRMLSSSQILSKEPNLSTRVKGGVHIPGEIVVDPWLYSISLAVHARENGASIYTNCKFDTNKSSFDSHDEIWNIVVRDKSKDSDGETTQRFMKAKAIVNAGGLWADTIQKQTLSKSQHGREHEGEDKHTIPSSKEWTAKPRRGQYRIFSSNGKTSLTHPIQPIPTQRTKGIFVFSSFYNHIVVGPTASDQESKTDRSINAIVAQELDLHVKRILPFVDTGRDYIGEYVGIRPGTDKRDYQIHLLPKKNWIAVAGIRSTGLTASLGIGNYVIRNLHVILDNNNCKQLDKSAVPTTTAAAIATHTNTTTPLPTLDYLVANYQKRADGMVEIHGYDYKVTHPLTQLGWSQKFFTRSKI